ncbi:MAG: class I SAM-dependent rRNA methyltransferase, partial [Treponema sp.]|nr:class I SAM-dependent rRNA methyltransferase [Treponema sp.]
MMVRVFLNAKEEKEILQGFLWVFDNEISHIKYQKCEGGEWVNDSLKDCTVPDGTIVEVCNKAGGFLGTGV